MCRRISISLLAVLLTGCSNSPDRFDAPTVDIETAATQAVSLYDSNTDGTLSKEELAKVPGILGRLESYDHNHDGAIDGSEIQTQLGRLLNRTGGTQLSALVTFKGRPLQGAKVVMEPEPYLGDQIQAAAAVSDGAGVAELAIPPEYSPEHLRRLKMVHYGTFKVRITHPTIQLPAKYNTQTTLGYETEPGKPTITFALQ
jgi:hypothetical protein